MSKSLNYLLPKNFKNKFPVSFEFLRFIKNKDFIPFIRFIANGNVHLKFTEKISFLYKCFMINTKVNSPHRQHDVLSFIEKMFEYKNSDGVFVECGCFKGSSTSKFSLAAKHLNKKLIVFDSFEGIPENSENHDYNIYGEKSGFAKGSFMGGLEEVKDNITKYGSIDNCTFIKGWFDKTMPGFNEKINAIYIDVDLASSTMTCLEYLYPLTLKGGTIMSQDGHLPLVIDVFKNIDFWKSKFNIDPPRIDHLGIEKLIYFYK
jgi:O-methyltransferase